MLGIFAQLSEQGRTIVLITHEEDVAAHARQVIRIRDGQIIANKLRSGLTIHGFSIPSHPEGGGTSTTRTRTPPAGGATASNPTRQAAFKASGATGQHTNSG